MRGRTAFSTNASRGVAAVLVGALAFAASLFTATARRPVVSIGIDGDSSVAYRGFYPAEHAAARTFAWTQPTAELSLPGLDRRTAWRWSARAALWRPPGVPQPRVRIAVDGVEIVNRALSHNFETLDVVIPRRPDKSGVALTFDTMPGFVPGAGDSRELGIALESMTLQPVNGRPTPSASALAAGSVAIVVLGMSLVVMHVPSRWVLGLVLLASIAQSWTLTRGLAEFGTYPRHLMTLAFSIAAGTWAAVRTIETIRRERLSAPARVVVAFSAFACYVKLLVLLHPMMPAGDSIFHAHRFEQVLGGRFYFTSLAPGNYAFPYPILLYLFAAPFSFLTTSTLDRVAVLRIIVTAADAVAGAMLYWMLAKATKDTVAAATTAVWYHLIPATSWIMTWGNLTNAFGQTLFVAALAGIVALPVERSKPRTILALALLAAAALLAHPSTCAILAAILVTTTGLYAWRGGPVFQGAAGGVGVATLVAAAAAFVLYYAWFPAVYLRELGRVAAETAARAAEPAAAIPGLSVTARIEMIPALASQYFGWPAMVVALVGAWRLRAGGGCSRLTLLLVAWTAVSLVFLVIGLVTPVQMRYHFAAFPAVAVAAAFGWSWAWSGRLPLRAGAMLVLSAAAWVGLQQWMALLT